MNFWDRFVRAVCFGLAADAAGRGAALRVLDLAFTRGRLNPATLDDTSLLLLLALFPESSSNRGPLLAEVLARGLHLQADAARLIPDAAPPRLAELVELARAPTPELRNLVVTALWEPADLGVIERVSLYLGRLWLGDPDGLPLRTIARGLIAEATRRYATIPPGTYDYRGYLFRWVRVRTQSPNVPFPVVFPPGPRPAWFTALEPDEQQFIGTCHRDLIEPAVDVLYLHVYAGLSVSQIAQALRLLQPEGAEEAIVRRLEECWGSCCEGSPFAAE